MQGQRIKIWEDGEYRAWIENNFLFVFILNTVINYKGVVLERDVRASYRDVTSDSCWSDLLTLRVSLEKLAKPEHLK